MNRRILQFFLLYGSALLTFSCESTSKKKGSTVQGVSQNEQEENGQEKDVIYRSKINFAAGSQFVYTMTNESATELEVNNQTINVLQKSDLGVTYDVQKDSSGNYLLKVHFDKIHLYSKKGDQETDLDAENAAATLVPVEKMLGMLKDANISATISSTGKVESINGYKELGEKIVAGFNTDAASRNRAKDQWEKVIGEGMVKKSIEQLFSMLPETARRVGDTWQNNSKQKGEMEMNVASTFKLKEIDNGIATIESEGNITSGQAAANLMGYPVTGDLKGEHEGKCEVDTKTGMVLKNNTTSKVNGTIQMMGKDIPVSITTTFTVNGKKVK